MDRRYSYEGNTGFRTGPMFNPIPLEQMVGIGQHLQNKYDTSYAATLEAIDKYRSYGTEYDLHPEEIAMKNKYIDNFIDNVNQNVATKYNGDWGTAAKEVSSAVVGAKNSPIWNSLAQAHGIRSTTKQFALNNPHDALISKSIERPLFDARGRMLSDASPAMLTTTGLQKDWLTEYGPMAHKKRSWVKSPDGKTMSLTVNGQTINIPYAEFKEGMTLGLTAPEIEEEFADTIKDKSGKLIKNYKADQKVQQTLNNNPTLKRYLDNMYGDDSAAKDKWVKDFNYRMAKGNLEMGYTQQANQQLLTGLLKDNGGSGNKPPYSPQLDIISGNAFTKDEENIINDEDILDIFDSKGNPYQLSKKEKTEKSLLGKESKITYYEPDPGIPKTDWNNLVDKYGQSHIFGSGDYGITLDPEKSVELKNKIDIVDKIISGMRDIYGDDVKGMNPKQIFQLYQSNEKYRSAIIPAKVGLSQDKYAINNSDQFFSGTKLDNHIVYLNNERVEPSDIREKFAEEKVRYGDVAHQFYVNFDSKLGEATLQSSIGKSSIEVIPEETTREVLKVPYNLYHGIVDLKSNEKIKKVKVDGSNSNYYVVNVKGHRYVTHFTDNQYNQVKDLPPDQIVATAYQNGLITTFSDVRKEAFQKLWELEKITSVKQQK